MPGSMQGHSALHNPLKVGSPDHRIVPRGMGRPEFRLRGIGGGVAVDGKALEVEQQVQRTVFEPSDRSRLLPPGEVQHQDGLERAVHDGPWIAFHIPARELSMAEPSARGSELQDCAGGPENL